jgi:hypothetical protein
MVAGAVPFEFNDIEEARFVAFLLRRQAAALEVGAAKSSSESSQENLKAQAQKALAIAIRIDGAADR